MSEIRLIDANALKESFIGYTLFTANTVIENIDNTPTIDFEKLGASLRCQIRAEYGSCDDCELSCPRNELIKLLDLERPHGEWVRKPNEHRVNICCTNCGYDDGYSCFKFCPNCGADMRKGEKK